MCHARWRGPPRACHISPLPPLPLLISRLPDFLSFCRPSSPLRQSSLWISRKIINSGRWGEEPADASVTIYLIIAPSKIWQDGSSKLKVDGEFGKVGTVGSAQQKIWQDGPGSHKFWGKHGHVRLARGVRDRHARPRTRHVAGDCASSSPGIFTAPHARKPATRRRGPTPG